MAAVLPTSRTLLHSVSGTVSCPECDARLSFEDHPVRIGNKNHCGNEWDLQKICSNCSIEFKIRVDIFLLGD
jgi:primosomal protein N'